MVVILVVFVTYIYIEELLLWLYITVVLGVNCDASKVHKFT